MYVRFVTDLRDGKTNHQVGVIRSVWQPLTAWRKVRHW